MEIRRAVSHGANWGLALGHVPALLELIDEQRIPVDIRQLQDARMVLLSAGTVYCRSHASSLTLQGSDASVPIELDRLREARAVSRAAGSSRRISLQLLFESGASWLTITGPAIGDGLAGQVWQTVMDSLLTDSAKALSQEPVAFPVLPVPQGVRVAQWPEPTTRPNWRRATPRGDVAGMGLTSGSQG